MGTGPRLLVTITILFISLLTGCVPAYKSVESGPMAEVTFEGKSLNRSLLTVTSLDFWIYGCKNNSLDSSIVNYKEGRDATYTVRAGTPLRIGVDYSKKDGPTHYSGKLYLAFVPEEDGKYLVKYEGLDRKKFKVSVQRYDQSSGTLETVPYMTKPDVYHICDIQ